MHLSLKRIPRMLRVSNRCPECGSPSFHHTRDKHACARCGLVIQVMEFPEERRWR